MAGDVPRRSVSAPSGAGRRCGSHRAQRVHGRPRARREADDRHPHAVASLAPIAAYARPLEALGYVYRPQAEAVALAGPEQRFFRPPRSREFHLHVCAAGGAYERDQLLFRDYLRAHPISAEEYGALKLLLAHRHAGDRTAYLAAKSGFVGATLEAARA